MSELADTVNAMLSKAKPGDPAIDALDMPRYSDGRYLKCAFLVCAQCDNARIFLLLPDTTECFGDLHDPADCDDCTPERQFGLAEWLKS